MRRLTLRNKPTILDRLLTVAFDLFVTPEVKPQSVCGGLRFGAACPAHSSGASVMDLCGGTQGQSA